MNYDNENKNEFDLTDNDNNKNSACLDTNNDSFCDTAQGTAEDKDNIIGDNEISADELEKPFVPSQDDDKEDGNFGDNEISADELEKPFVPSQDDDKEDGNFGDNEISADELEKTSDSLSDENTSSTSGSPLFSDRAEIEYNVDKNNNSYSCNFVNPASEKTQKKHGSGSKIAAIAVAAVASALLIALLGISISGFIKSRNTVTDDKATDDDIFQMEIPTEADPVLTVAAADNSEKASSSDKVGEVVSASKPVSVEKIDLPSVLSVNDIAQKCLPSSVGIMVELEQYYFGRVYVTTGVGSGFILSENGYIATNNHVVSGATKITVVLNDGSEYEAEIVGTDSVTDIAVIKIEAEGLPVMERGNSDNVKVGDLAVAIGTPASIELAGTVTDGIISAVGRKIDITDDYGRVTKTMHLIQTNATINPGNSGGPLINRYGEVIGINTLKLTDEFEGIGFAIPINGAISIMNQLIKDGEVSDRNDGLVSGNASIGIQCADISEAEAEYYGIPRGVLVIQINKNGSAAKAGLRRGDIIIGFEGEDVKTTEDINNIKKDYKVGDKVTLTVYRDDDDGGEEIDITFKLDMQE